jgi:hypothetical protein
VLPAGKFTANTVRPKGRANSDETVPAADWLDRNAGRHL